MTLQLASVCKTYRRFGKPPVAAVKLLDLEVADGETMALLGSSGCGKTSSLRMIAGFEAVTSGAIKLKARRIDTLPPARRGVAMAFETYALYPPLTIAENIGFALAADRSARGSAASRVRQIADLLEITPILERRPAGLSGGEQQRASLARALIRNVDLHLLDEPMSQLEPQLRAVLRGRVKSLLRERGYTAVFVTHDQTEANALADRIAVMEGGVLQQCGTAEELRERPSNTFVATFFGEPPMNLLPAIAEPAVARLTGAPEIALPLAVPLALAEGQAIEIGIRPHRIQLGNFPLRGIVLSNQWLGDEAHIAVEFAGRTIVAVSPVRIAVRAGDAIGLGIDPASLHVFDRMSGCALAHGGMRA
jgi:multiple sugar transport system ATP-binding protein